MTPGRLRSNARTPLIVLWDLQVARPLNLDYDTEVPGLVPGRKFRADVLILPDNIVVELEGGVAPVKRWDGDSRRGAHGSVSGVLRDIEKSNEYAIAGYTLLRFTRRMLEDGTALDAVSRALAARQSAASAASSSGTDLVRTVGRSTT